MSHPLETLVVGMMTQDTTVARPVVVPAVMIQTAKIVRAVDGLVADARNQIRVMATRVVVVSFAERKFRLGTKRLRR